MTLKAEYLKSILEKIGRGETIIMAGVGSGLTAKGAREGGLIFWQHIIQRFTVLRDYQLHWRFFHMIIAMSWLSGCFPSACSSGGYTGYAWLGSS